MKQIEKSDSIEPNNSTSQGNESPANKQNNEPILNDLSNLDELTSKSSFNGGRLNESNDLIESKNKIITSETNHIDEKENILVKTESNGNLDFNIFLISFITK